MAHITNKIEVGRRVRIHLAYGHQPEGVIVSVEGEPGKNQDARIGPITYVTPGACRFQIVTFDGLRFDSRESSIGKPGIGRVDLLDKVHGPRLIEVAKASVIERQAREATEQVIAKQKFADALEKVKADYPYLLVAEGYVGAAHAAKNMRIEFKRAGIKVKSLRSRQFSGGNSIDVKLPHDASDETMKLANTIARKYSAGSFDGMDDSYTYNRTPFNETFGSARYVHVERDYRYEEPQA